VNEYSDKDQNWIEKHRMGAKKSVRKTSNAVEKISPTTRSPSAHKSRKREGEEDFDLRQFCSPIKDQSDCGWIFLNFFDISFQIFYFPKFLKFSRACWAFAVGFFCWKIVEFDILPNNCRQRECWSTWSMSSQARWRFYRNSSWMTATTWIWAVMEVKIFTIFLFRIFN
jgi:hypothetical protein